MSPNEGTKIGIQDVLESLANNDLRFEIMLSSLIEILKTKSTPLGAPLITEEEFATKVNEVQVEMAKQLSIARPKSGIILPN